MMRTFLLCRLFTTDWLKPEIVTGQYNSRAGAGNFKRNFSWWGWQVKLEKKK
jgi:hypothetical protein